MRPYFEPLEYRAVLLNEIISWKGTRFWAEAGGKAVKGVGADCVSFVEKVMVNVGAIDPIRWPPYVLYGGGDAMFELMVKVITSVPNLVEIWNEVQPIKPGFLEGDIVLRSGILERNQKDYHHLAIYGGDNTLYHMIDKRGLSTANIFDPQAMQGLRAIYRIYAKQNSNRSDAEPGLSSGSTADQSGNQSL